MSALETLFAPDVMPNTGSGEYQIAERILEDHPATAGMSWHDRASLAQNLVDEIVGDGEDEVADMVDEAYEAFETLLARPKLPGYVKDAIPDWAKQRYADENGAAA
jgi:hypothetical protein